MSSSRDVIARNLFEALATRRGPEEAAVIEYGLHSPAHEEALRRGTVSGRITEADLRRVFGHGIEITRMARQACDPLHDNLVYETGTDISAGRNTHAAFGNHRSGEPRGR